MIVLETLIQGGTKDTRFDPPFSTLHVGIFEGGIAHNIIADKCRIRWDMRTLPAEKLADILAEFNAFCSERITICRQKVPSFNIVTKEKFPLVVPLDTPTDASIVKLVQGLLNTSVINAVSFASEAGQFAAEGFEAIICGPGSIAQAHTANEFIEVDQLEKGVAFIQQLIKTHC